MKKLLIALGLLMASTGANAMWYVEICSPYYCGWGENPSFQVAYDRAKLSCQLNTPYGAECKVTVKHWY